MRNARTASSYVVLIDGTPRIPIDAGSGAFVRIGEAKLALDALDIVLLTHLHADHAAELPGLVKARAVSSSEPIAFKIFGPPSVEPSDHPRPTPTAGRSWTRSAAAMADR